MTHRDQATFDSFKKYWDKYPQQRFFQALRNWIGCGFLKADNEDTFYWGMRKPVETPYEKAIKKAKLK